MDDFHGFEAWHSPLFAELRNCQHRSPYVDGRPDVDAVRATGDYSDLRAALSMSQMIPLIDNIWNPLELIFGDASCFAAYADPTVFEWTAYGQALRSAFRGEILEHIVEAARRLEQQGGFSAEFEQLSTFARLASDDPDASHWSDFLREAMRPGAKYLIELCAMGYRLQRLHGARCDQEGLVRKLLFRSEPLLLLTASLGAGPAKVLLSYTSREDDPEIGFTNERAFEVFSSGSPELSFIRIKECVLRKAIRHAREVVESWSLRFGCPALFSKKGGCTLIQFVFRKVAGIFCRAAGCPS